MSDMRNMDDILKLPFTEWANMNVISLDTIDASRHVQNSKAGGPYGRKRHVRNRFQPTETNSGNFARTERRQNGHGTDNVGYQLGKVAK